MAELLQHHEDEIGSISLIPSDGGRFEVSVDDKLVYSKLKTARHAEPGEVERLIRWKGGGGG
jgi:selenoprotein W-related protein